MIQKVDFTDLGRFAGEHFVDHHWLEIGGLTGFLDVIKGHPRLLRSLHWGAPDYPDCCRAMMAQIIAADIHNEDIIRSYVERNFGEFGGVNISSDQNEGGRIYVVPTAFDKPAEDANQDIVSVMMPFSVDFGKVYDAIKECVEKAGLECERADNVWSHSVVVQDIFSLIYRSSIVICDFTGKNPNVFYETGISHALGRAVIPITQNEEHIPFDLRHHRYLKYLPNNEGIAQLKENLHKRVVTLTKQLKIGHYRIS